MKYISRESDKVVSTKNGFVTFKDGKYETTNKDEQQSLTKAKGVRRVDAQKEEPTP